VYALAAHSSIQRQPRRSFYLSPVGDAREIIKGAKPATALAIRALDDLAFQFDLTAPTPWLLRLFWQHC
jgi:ABC-type oligopeptide transport system substrate-binding subunit